MKLFVTVFCPIVLLLTSGCATVIKSPLSSDEASKFEQALAKDNADEIKDLLKDKSFMGTSVPWQNEEWKAYYYLDLAITGYSQYRAEYLTLGVCRTESVRAIIAKNLPPRPIDLAHAAEVPCPEMMDVIASKLSADNINKAADLFFDWFYESVPKGTIVSVSSWSEILNWFSKKANGQDEHISQAKEILEKQNGIHSSVASSEDPSCVDTSHWPFEIVQKIDSHTYEVVAESGNLHKILKTKEAVFTRTGHPLGIKVRDSHRGMTATLKNGFSAYYPVYEECGLVPLLSPEQVNSFAGGALRERIKGVDSESSRSQCINACFQKFQMGDTKRKNACYSTCGSQ